MYRYKESYNLGQGEIVVEVKEFETRKEARDYMNSRVKEVKKGFECGITLEKYDDFKPKDIFEVYVMEEIKRA